MPSQRVSPPRVFPVATRAGKPPLEAAGSADSYRQMSFVLGDEVDLVLRGLKLEAGIAEASAGAKFRKQVTASCMALWSRAWLNRLEALHAMEWGNYVAAMPLLRAAADSMAGEIYLLRQGATEWDEWLEGGGVGTAPDDQATEFRLHAFRAAEILAAHEVLGPLYRVVTDLSLPHFGSTLLLAGSESNHERIMVTFGDRDFHLGLAELCLGWLLSLGVAQQDAIMESGAAFARTATDEASAWCREAKQALSRDDRCRVEVVERDGMQRYLVHNWRRAPGTARKRILL